MNSYVKQNLKIVPFSFQYMKKGFFLARVACNIVASLKANSAIEYINKTGPVSNRAIHIRDDISLIVQYTFVLLKMELHVT